jgi:pimeloyl-ACP methyl ester carboxylesterase
VPPKTRYAKSGDVHIAYQVVGDASRDLVLVPGWVSHVEHLWDEPAVARFLTRLSSFSRLILMDRRGTGLSDPVASLPTLEERMEDLRAVMDAAGSQKAALFGISEGGPMTSLFAATYPDRTTGLVLYGTFARGTADPEYPWRPTSEQIQRALNRMEAEWGTGVSARAFAPSLRQDAAQMEAWGRIERLSVSPGGMRMLIQMAMDADVRSVLPAIRVPTLVLHRTGDRVTRVEGARYIADRIPGARYVELPGDDHYPWIGDQDALLDEVEEFLTGVRPVPEPDRMLATVLFTDIVGSSERAAELGDRAWGDLLERYYAIARREKDRFKGREVSTAGDGYFAAFDGPARAVRCACAIRDAVRALGIEIRAGLHTGECEVKGEKIGGIAVHIGARVAAAAGPGEVLVSSTVKDLVAGSGLRFADRGTRVLKGVPGEWRLYAVEG